MWFIRKSVKGTESTSGTMKWELQDAQNVFEKAACESNGHHSRNSFQPMDPEEANAKERATSGQGVQLFYDKQGIRWNPLTLLWPPLHPSIGSSIQSANNFCKKIVLKWIFFVDRWQYHTLPLNSFGLFWCFWILYEFSKTNIDRIHFNLVMKGLISQSWALVTMEMRP